MRSLRGAVLFLALGSVAVCEVLALDGDVVGDMARVCQTPQMNEEPRRDSQGRPMKYTPGSLDTPRWWRGLPSRSKASTCSQPKSTA